MLTGNPADDCQQQGDNKVLVETPVLKEYGERRQQDRADEQSDVSSGDSHNGKRQADLYTGTDLSLTIK